MKSKFFKLALIIAATSQWYTPMLAANLTITPATITNDFVGRITFAITGLTASQNVFLEKWFDLNTNGILDATDIMAQSYRVRDGKQPFIGGVRNINVPGDEDGATNGQIVIKLFYPGISAGVDLIAGTYLIKVSDGATGAPLVTNAFVIQQREFPQGVTGQVTAVGGQPLSNTPIVLVPPHGGPVAGTVTDGNGQYTLYSPPGNYVALALHPGFVADFNGGAAVSVDTFVTLNLTLTPATRTISGKLQDSSTATGIPGVFIQAQSDAGQFVNTFTDANGNYSLTVVDGQWSVEPDGDQLAQVGYVGWMDGTGAIVAGNVTDFNLSVPKANALIYGRVADNEGHPVWGIELDAGDATRFYNTRGRAYPTNGNYCLGVVAGDWLYVGPSSEDLQARGYLAQNTNVTVAVNQAVSVDFTLYQFNAHIMGRVVDNNVQGVGNVQVYADNHEGTHANAQTDSNGDFDLGVFGGTWYLSISSAQEEGLIITNEITVTLTNGETRSNVLVVVQRPTAQVCGRVVNGGNGVGNIWVNVGLTNSFLMLGTRTDANGYFCANVFGGTWQLAVEQTELQARGLLSAAPPVVTVVDGVNQNNILITLQSVTGQIVGTIQDNSGNPVWNLFVWGFVTVGDVQYDQYTWTDSAGNYVLAICNGNWQVGLDCGGDVGLESRGYLCPNFVQTNFSGGTLALNFVVYPNSPLQITTTSLPGGTVGQSYSAQLLAIGGQFPYSWSQVNGAGPLPPGLNLSDTGLISGTPTSTGTYNFGICVADGFSIADTNLSISIQDSGSSRPVITQFIHPAPGQFDFNVNVAATGQYTVQFTTNLGAGWFPLFTTNVTGAFFQFHDSSATNTYRFYRIQGP